MNIPRDEELVGIQRMVETYLHQDWTIDGNTLEKVFESNEGFAGIAEDIKGGAQVLIESDLSDHELEKIMLGWGRVRTGSRRIR